MTNEKNKPTPDPAPKPDKPPKAAPERKTPGKWAKELKVDPAIHQAAMVLSGADPDKEMSKGEFQRGLDAFLKANPADRS